MAVASDWSFRTKDTVPSNIGRRLVGVAIIGDVLLAIFVLVIAIRGLANTGASWVGPATALPLLALIMVMFLWFAYICWKYQGPDRRRHHATLTIMALLVTTAAIILAFTAIYWKTAYITELQAFYDAVGTLTGGQHPSMTNTTVGLLVTSQELIDLVFLGGVVTVALGRAFSGPTTTSSLSDLLPQLSRVGQARSRRLPCYARVAVTTLGRPPHRARGGHGPGLDQLLDLNELMLCLHAWPSKRIREVEYADRCVLPTA